MILIKIFNFCWKITNKLIYIGVYVESRGFCLASPPNIFFISKLIIIDWSITLCDVTPESRIYRYVMFLKFGQLRKKAMYNNAFHNIAGFSLTLFGKLSMNLNLNKKLDLFNKKKNSTVFFLPLIYH